MSELEIRFLLNKDLLGTDCGSGTEMGGMGFTNEKNAASKF